MCLSVKQWVNWVILSSFLGAMGNDQQVSEVPDTDSDEELSQAEIILQKLASSHSYRWDLGCLQPPFYTCEEPDVVVADTGTLCNYMNHRYSEQIFRWVAGQGCLLYTPDVLFVNSTNNVKTNAACLYGDNYAPCLEMAMPDGSCGCYPLDPSFPEVLATIKFALVAAAQNRWEKCFKTAADCCRNMKTYKNDSGAGFCDPTFDGWTCWNATKVDTTATALCSEFGYSNGSPPCNHYSSKKCYKDGSWEIQTDYSTCSIRSLLVSRTYFHIYTLSASIVICLPALVFLIYYKKQEDGERILHMNLLLIIILRNIFIIVSRYKSHIDELTHEDNILTKGMWWCKMLAVLEHFCGNYVYVCMLIEGVYMHRAIVSFFRKRFKILVLNLFGIVIAVLPLAAWTFVMLSSNDHSCWITAGEPHARWILDAPNILILCLNMVLVLDIFRILTAKIKTPEYAKQMNAVKSSLIVTPLFGSKFLVRALSPSSDECTLEQVYHMLWYSAEALEGVIVATVYCFLKKEVQSLLSLSFKKIEFTVVTRVISNSIMRTVNRSKIGLEAFNSVLKSEQAESSDRNILTQNQELVLNKTHTAEIITIPQETVTEIEAPRYFTVTRASVTRSVSESGYKQNEFQDIRYLKPIICIKRSNSLMTENIQCESSMFTEESYSSFSNYAASLDTSTADVTSLTYSDSLDTYSLKDEKILGDHVNRSDYIEDTEKIHLFLEGEPLREVNNNETGNLTQSLTEPVLNPEALSPNRPDNEKMVFVD